VEIQLKRKHIQEESSQREGQALERKSLKKRSEESENREWATSMTSPNTSKTSSIKCFKCLGKGYISSQCPNKRTTVRREDGEMMKNTSSTCKASKDLSPHEGDISMETESQRENIFHTRCLMLGRVCSLIIDRESYVNVVSVRLVQKLALSTILYPIPYKHKWLSEKGELVVDRQVRVTFSIWSYKDQVLCYVVTMEAAHILLGRP
ncbi:hypothetical protein CR513_11174, partial [Mucuna pruriens]